MREVKRGIVFVPGVPGSTLIDKESGKKLFFRFRDLDSAHWRRNNLSRLRGPENPGADDEVEAGEPIASLFKVHEPLVDVAQGKQAAAFYDLLRREGYRQGQGVQGVGWDWRRPIDDSRVHEGLAAAIESQREASGEPIVLFAHGAGGLVVKTLLESRPELCDAVGDLVTCGVPWAGTLDPLPLLLGNRKYPPLDKRQLHDFLSYAWSLYDLLPPDPEKTPLEDDEGPLGLFTVQGGPASPLTATAWAGTKKLAYVRKRAAHADARLGERQPTLQLGKRGLRIWNLVGWGLETVLTAELEKKEVVFADPEPDGDGIVPRRSAAWLRGDDVSTLYLPLGGFTPMGHDVLWRNKGAAELLRRLVRDGSGPLHHVHAAVDVGDAESDPATVRVRFVAQGEDGKALPEATVQAVDREEGIPFPESGRLMVRIHRHRWRQVRHDIRQIRVTVGWQGELGPQRRDLTVLTGGGGR